MINNQEIFRKEFEGIFDTYWPKIFGILYRIVGEEALADELALEVFMRLYKHPKMLHKNENLAGWLFRVATNLGYNAIRANKRRRQYEVQAGILAINENHSPDPAKEIERASEREQVRNILARLKPRDSQILLLRYSGLSYKEIASTLKIAINSVGTLLARAEREFEKKYLEAFPD